MPNDYMQRIYDRAAMDAGKLAPLPSSGCVTSGSAICSDP